MELFRRVLKVLGLVLLVIGLLVYLFGPISSSGGGIDYGGIGKLSSVLGFVLILISLSTRRDDTGQLARKTSVNLLGVLLAFFFLFSAWGLYALGLSLYAIVLVVAGLYLLVRVLWSFRSKN